MTKEVEIAEREAAATPRDYPQDFRHPHAGWNVCVICLHYYLAAPTRVQCRVCKESKCSPS